ncbi:hypothetical protein BP6252_07476 [Coleophoma cylindrospora]|uniref:NAD-dependent epimerase/dehydratase domain-containing protein n=1 Tax=Coleophoma cylindrospora TaxID=1849047 RepID=A0A3D8RHN8_9HELO|nr:hypothetical protein BP6252_07476 [Coleophoma cylindrospora]
MTSQLILITGVSGYIGFKTMIIALEAGHQVRAVIRRHEQASRLTVHPRVQDYVSRLEFVVVPDLARTAAFDPILTNVVGILHLASPLAIETDDFEKDIVQAAIGVTNSVLKAAKRHPSIRRVVMTSSAVTLIPYEWLSNPDSEAVFTELDINSNPIRPFHNSMQAYWASKALSRMASNSFIAERKPQFELINLLPTVVIGPDELATDAASLLSGTRALVMGPVLGQKSDIALLGIQVHVDDVARAHVDALNPSVPGNSEYVLSSDGPDGIQWNDAVEIIASAFPGAMATLPLDGSLDTIKVKIDVSTTEKAFRWKFQSFRRAMKDLVGQYLELLEGEER